MREVVSMGRMTKVASTGPEFIELDMEEFKRNEETIAKLLAVITAAGEPRADGGITVRCSALLCHLAVGSSIRWERTMPARCFIAPSKFLVACGLILRCFPGYDSNVIW